MAFKIENSWLFLFKLKIFQKKTNELTNSFILAGFGGGGDNVGVIFKIEARVFAHELNINVKIIQI
jgi:hypothetical protein